MNDVGLVIVAAGRGERLGRPEPKALVPLLGHPLLAWTLLAFDDFHEIVERVVVVPPGSEALFREQVLAPLHLQRDVDLVAGGAERQDSVFNGIDALGGKPHWIVVHDAARPLVSRDLIRRVLDRLDGGESLVPALPLRDSVARVGYEPGSRLRGPLRAARGADAPGLSSTGSRVRASTRAGGALQGHRRSVPRLAHQSSGVVARG